MSDQDATTTEQKEEMIRIILDPSEAFDKPIKVHTGEKIQIVIMPTVQSESE
jgi:hypothetical protein